MTFTTVECVQELSGAVSERKLLGIFKLKQNENTSMLTWPNNVYLGPALVEGTYGMDNNPVLPDMSSTTFYRLLGGLLRSTILFALCLSTIMRVIRFIWRGLTNLVQQAWEIGRRQVRKNWKGTYLWATFYQLSFTKLLDSEVESLKRTKGGVNDVESGASTSQGMESNSVAVMDRMQ